MRYEIDLQKSDSLHIIGRVYRFILTSRRIIRISMKKKVISRNLIISNISPLIFIPKYEHKISRLQELRSIADQ